MTKVRIGLVQMTTGTNYDENLKKITDIIDYLSHQGVDIIVTPENTPIMDKNRANLLAYADSDENAPFTQSMRDIAVKNNVWLVIGSQPWRLADNKLANRCTVISAEGEVVAFYDKIHMCDIVLPDGRALCESACFTAGKRAVVVDTPFGKLGLSICYDVRFPHLYRCLAQAGADILLVPSAFTVPTGHLHWHTLLQTRAIENGCFVVAPDQWGHHSDGRKTFGHSLVVSPWGRVICDLKEQEIAKVVEIDMQEIVSYRSSVPSMLNHQKFSLISDEN